MTSAPALPPSGRKRKHRSLRIEITACLYHCIGAGIPLPSGIWTEDRLSGKPVLDLLLRLLGINPDQPWEMQHSPPLALRPWDDEAYDYVPAENDPRAMYPLQTPAHKAVTSAVDRPAIDKARRQGDGQAAHHARMEAKGTPAPKVLGSFPSAKAKLRAVASAQKKKWPSRPLQSRGFQKPTPAKL